ncbi:793_t:CDS:2 [Ambispora gerdemannii]|uniref:793_t:CDS:1 n=1 Tax=Ambispora gerdemannii TaxID=144530 RepID=A0A9N8VER8_9GLOM|nr:793_t:CDS:2 [Ambispora gerdemannii]
MGQNPLFYWQREMMMLTANTQEDINDWVIGSDKDFGGTSEVKFELTPEGYGKFHGNITTPTSSPSTNINNIHKSQRPKFGYAGIRTKKSKFTLLGTPAWDTTLFRYLTMRLRGDRRKYYVNLQTDTPILTDLWQHRLFLRRPGEWEIVMIPFEDFILTNHGVIQTPQILMMRERINTIGFSVLDRKTGPFSLEIDYIKAMNTEFSEGDYDRLRRPSDEYNFKEL